MRYPRQTHILLKSSYYVNKDLDQKKLLVAKSS